MRNYCLALFAVATALGLTLLMQRFLPYPVVFLFFAAVMVSAWFGGTGPGLGSVFASTIAVDYFFVRPVHSFAIDATDGIYFASFVVCALAAGWVSSVKRRDEEALRETRDQLEVRVAERTAELQRSNLELQESIREHDAARQALLKTQAELAELSRFLTMAELTASISHEINQPLTAVAVYARACLEWLSANPPNFEEARRAAEIIIDDSTRAGTVLNRIRALFKRQPVVKCCVDLNALISEATAFASEDAARSGVAIMTDLDPGLPKILGDRVQLQQVILNLIINAIDALREMTERKRIMIRSSRHGTDGVLVSVDDSGNGISSEIACKIFDPFFTTKSQGIGMGLSISRSIIESHGGRLWFDRAVSGGAKFQFTLPSRG